MSGSISERPFGNWAGLAQSAAKLYLEAGGVVGAGAAVDLIAGFLGLAKAQTVLLESIQANTELLRTAALKTAQDYLADAHRLGPQDPRYRGFLEEARRELYHARNLAASPAERSVVESHLAIVYLLQGEILDAQHFIEKASVSAEEALDSLVIACQKGPGQITLQVRDLRSSGRKPTSLNGWRAVRAMMWVTGGVFHTPGVFAVSGLMAFLDSPQEKRLAMLKDYIGSYNALHVWRAKLCGFSAPSPLVLTVLTDEQKAAGKEKTSHEVALLGTEEQLAAELKRRRLAEPEQPDPARGRLNRTGGVNCRSRPKRWTGSMRD